MQDKAKLERFRLKVWPTYSATLLAVTFLQMTLPVGSGDLLGGGDGAVALEDVVAGQLSTAVPQHVDGVGVDVLHLKLTHPAWQHKQLRISTETQAIVSCSLALLLTLVVNDSSNTWTKGM